MARRVTQMRSLGIMLSTSVQADRQGPSMTTRSPDARTSSNRSRNGPTWPPGLDRMRTSASTGETSAINVANKKMTSKGCRLLMLFLSIPPRATQRWQPDSCCIEAPIDGENLTGNVAGALATQKKDRFREFLFQSVAIEWNGVVIVGADFRRV